MLTHLPSTYLTQSTVLQQRDYHRTSGENFGEVRKEEDDKETNVFKEIVVCHIDNRGKVHMLCVYACSAIKFCIYYKEPIARVH